MPKNLKVQGYNKLALNYWELSLIWNGSARGIKTNMSSGEMIDELREVIEQGIQVEHVYNRKYLGYLADNLLQEVILGRGRTYHDECEIKHLKFSSPKNELVTNEQTQEAEVRI